MQFRHLILFTIGLLFSPSISRGEYRVFQLRFTDGTGKITKEFPSTLDPLQYPGYYLVPKGTLIQYTDTWMCPGFTGDMKPLCLNPKATLDQSIPEKINPTEDKTSKQNTPQTITPKTQLVPNSPPP